MTADEIRTYFSEFQIQANIAPEQLPFIALSVAVETAAQLAELNAGLRENFGIPKQFQGDTIGDETPAPATPDGNGTLAGDIDPIERCRHCGKAIYQDLLGKWVHNTQPAIYSCFLPDKATRAEPRR